MNCASVQMKVNRVSDFSESQAKLDDVEASFGAGISLVQHSSERSVKQSFISPPLCPK